jgi:hypothetical protein
MTKRLVQLGVLLALGTLMATVATASILVSTQGVFSDPNQVFEQSFSYDPATMGSILRIQTYGYGGSSNAPGGTNAFGTIILAGGFDPIVGLFAGSASGGGARLGFNDDGTCGAGAGATDGGICFDSTLVFNSLAAGTYTVALTVFPNFPPTTETGAYPGGPGTFGGRANRFAIDVVTSSAVPEPMSSLLLGTGLLAIGFLARRRRSQQ